MGTATNSPPSWPWKQRTSPEANWLAVPDFPDQRAAHTPRRPDNSSNPRQWEIAPVPGYFSATVAAASFGGQPSSARVVRALPTKPAATAAEGAYWGAFLLTGKEIRLCGGRGTAGLLKLAAAIPPRSLALSIRIIALPHSQPPCRRVKRGIGKLPSPPALPPAVGSLCLSNQRLYHVAG